MYGFEVDSTTLVDLARELQDYLYQKCGGVNKFQVSVSLEAYSAAIDVDQETIWCSETHGDVSLAILIDLLETRAGEWAELTSSGTVIQTNENANG